MHLLGRFFKSESASGIILFLSGLAAFILCNSPWAFWYEHLLATSIHIQIGEGSINQPFLFWINEGLMSLFFLTVGLELKHEMLAGELAHFSQVILPAVAALGGMVIPAMIYWAINHHHPEALRGWAVPVATDIAFALGVLSLFGKRVPKGLKYFLMALAIFDDLGAIIIIAIFNTESLALWSLAISALIIAVLISLNYANVQKTSLYLLLGVLLWLCVLQSGVHSTVAGVLLGIIIPFKIKDVAVSPVIRLQYAMHPWVAFVILPLFAFANAGLTLHGLNQHIMLETVVVGSVCGLFFGKQLGVFGFAWLVVKLGFAKLPKNTQWSQLYGVAILCGIGFTMSLFLGTLAFQESSPSYLIQVRIGVLIGSLISGIFGVYLLQNVLAKKPAA